MRSEDQDKENRKMKIEQNYGYKDEGERQNERK